MKILKSIQELADTLDKYRSSSVLLTFHSKGDTDSLSSSIALSQMFENPIVAYPDMISNNTSRIMRSIGYDPRSLEKEFPASARAVILLDANNFDECGKFRDKLNAFNGPIIIIDHHVPNHISGSNIIMFNDESYNSATSIVYELLKLIGAKIDERTAKLLLTGIISDSAELKNSTAQTFIEIGELLNVAHSEYQDLLDTIVHIAEPETRAETIGDLMASTVVIRSDVLFVYGVARGHANIAADSAIRIGADVSLFQSGGGKSVSFSARLRPNSYAICP